MQGNEAIVHTKILKNGLTVLVREVKNIQKVSLRLWYKAGSRDEVDGQRGIAHLLEHMLFKGTEKLSATDIDLIGHKLGANFNAYTTEDHTRMVFDVPIQHWRIIMTILADCMNNCTIKQEHLNSEFKVVLAEFKRARDSHVRQLFRDMSKILYPSHPYAHEVLGYKKDICAVNSQELMAFYKAFYVPNNAVLIVTGNVNHEEVFDVAEREFGSLKAKPIQTTSFSTQARGLPHTLELHRDVPQPYVLLAFKVPTFLQDSSLKILPLIDNILFNGHSGRVVKKLRDELQLIDSISFEHDDLLDAGTVWIGFSPRDHEKSSFKAIITLIQEELDTLAEKGYTQSEIETACEAFEQERNECFAYNSCQAEIVAEGHYHMGNPEFGYRLKYEPTDDFKQDIQSFIKTYLQQDNACIGYLLPANEEEKKAWRLEQEAEDVKDGEILASRPHKATHEEGKYIHTLVLDKRLDFKYPEPQSYTLSNGLKVLYYHTSQVPTIECGLDFKVTAHHKIEDTKNTLNTFTFMNTLLKEGGTAHYTSKELKEVLARHALSLHTSPGSIRGSLPSKSLPLFLNLLRELLAAPAFDDQELAKVKEWAKKGHKQLLNDQNKLAYLLHYDALTNSKVLAQASEKSITSITRQALVEAYNRYISPDGAVLALVGDLSMYTDLVGLLESTLGQWEGKPVADYDLEKAQDTSDIQIFEHYLDRDQLVLSLAKASADPKQPEFLALVLYSILLNQELFSLREKTGMFYAIRARLTEPFAQIVTQVSPENVNTVYTTLLDSLSIHIDTCTKENLQEAKNYFLEDLQNSYSSNSGMLKNFLYLHKHGLPFDRASLLEELENLTLSTFKKQVKKTLNPAAFNAVLVGRIGAPNTCNHLISTKQCSLLIPNSTMAAFDRN